MVLDEHNSIYLEQAAQPGQPLEVRGPFGTFGLEEKSLRPRYFIAGGTGLAPFLSMLRRMADWQEMHEVRLYFGVNREEELFCLSELDQLAAALPQLKVEICVWQPGPAWSGFQGTPVDALRRDLKGTPATPDLYLCGPPGLIDAAMEAAQNFGIPPEQIISERFLPSG